MASVGTRSIDDRLSSLYQQHAAGLLAFLCARLKDGARAEDHLHDIFIAYHHQSQRTVITDPKSYLYTAAHRMSLTTLRRDAVALRSRNEVARLRSFRAAPGGDLDSAELAQKALAGLDDEARDIIALRVFSELSFREIAESLELSITTVHRRYEEALVVMRGALTSDSRSRL